MNDGYKKQEEQEFQKISPASELDENKKGWKRDNSHTSIGHKFEDEIIDYIVICMIKNFENQTIFGKAISFISAGFADADILIDVGEEKICVFESKHNSTTGKINKGNNFKKALDQIMNEKYFHDTTKYDLFEPYIISKTKFSDIDINDSNITKIPLDSKIILNCLSIWVPDKNRNVIYFYLNEDENESLPLFDHDEISDKEFKELSDIRSYIENFSRLVKMAFTKTNVYDDDVIAKKLLDFLNKNNIWITKNLLVDYKKRNVNNLDEFIKESISEYCLQNEITDREKSNIKHNFKPLDIMKINELTNGKITKKILNEIKYFNNWNVFNNHIELLKTIINKVEK